MAVASQHSNEMAAGQLFPSQMKNGRHSVVPLTSAPEGDGG
jgi:hypothetical protein